MFLEEGLSARDVSGRGRGYLAEEDLHLVDWGGRAWVTSGLADCEDRCGEQGPRSGDGSASHDPSHSRSTLHLAVLTITTSDSSDYRYVRTASSSFSNTISVVMRFMPSRYSVETGYSSPGNSA